MTIYLLPKTNLLNDNGKGHVFACFEKLYVECFFFFSYYFFNMLILKLRQQELLEGKLLNKWDWGCF